MNYCLFMKTNVREVIRQGAGRNPIACLLGVLLAAPIQAAPSFAVADQDRSQESGFSLHFDDFGYVASAQITDTHFVLKFDDQAGTARFVHYDQFVDPLLLPGPVGPISTGAIRVQIESSVDGAYDPATGDFSTVDVYAVHFEGDLSLFQLTSPVYLPGSSMGTLSFDDAQGGTISLAWDGEGQLPNPFDPGTFIRFDYVCESGTVFRVPEPGDQDGDVDVDLKDFSFFQSCFSGAGTEYRASRCALVDYDEDGDVDLEDYPSVEANVTGPQ